MFNFRVNVVVRRLGGAYGGKISRGTHIATACAIAAYTLGKPVRVQLDLADNMMMVGGRLPYYCKYKVFHKLNLINPSSGKNDVIELYRLALMSKDYCKPSI